MSAQITLYIALTRQQYQRRSVECQRHRTALHISRLQEELELLDFGVDSREAHFGLLTSHVIQR